MDIRVDAWNGVLSCLHGDPKAVLSLLQVDSLFCWLLSSQAFSTTASLSIASTSSKQLLLRAQLPPLPIPVSVSTVCSLPAQTCTALHGLADHEQVWQSVAEACWRHLAAVGRTGYRTYKVCAA